MSDKDDKAAAQDRREQRRKRRNQKLFASALAGVLGAGALDAKKANASIQIEEDIFVASGDFPGEFSDATLLPVGADLVSADLDDPGFDSDFFKFTGLQPGATFTFSFESFESIGSFTVAFANLFTSDQSFLGFTDAESDPFTTPPTSVLNSFTGTVPADGMLVAAVDISETAEATYSVSLDAPLASTGGGAVPEPTSATVFGGLGLLGANAACSRRRRGKGETGGSV